MTRLAAFLVMLAAPVAADPVMRFDVAGNGFELQPEDILQVEAEPTDLGAVLFFRFAETPTQELRELTEASIGLPMDLIVCGRVVVSPVVMEVISSGVGQFNLGTLHDARALASVLHGDTPCVEYRGG